MRLYLIIAFFALANLAVMAQNHPSLILTKTGVGKIKSQLGTVPKFDNTLSITIQQVDAAIDEGIDVPVPKDLAGGYSHEVHKQNFFMLQKAGVLFQITGDEKYAIYIRDMFLQYAELFPTVDRHPATRSYARGKFFWQCLNDANWLVYSSQAYDCIYDWLDKKTRKKLNKELFRPMADFLSVETPQFFNRIHNHSTWGNAAVGMIGLVMEDDELIKRSLYGLDADVPADFITDNDGGLIKLPGQKEAGFLAQIDNSFSPDGYYTEGPYYQRYAMYPFLIFGQALQNAKPDLKIFEYRDAVLLKGVYALIEQTNGAGEFFPINDSQKGMSVLSRENVMAVSLAYQFGGKDKALLPYIAKQDRVPLNETGITAAIGLKETKGLEAIKRKSIELSDGAEGNEGALGILRSSTEQDEVTLVMKYTKQGMGHGHFDKLSFFYYLNGDEVIQDYGSARWVNIEQKDGGGYLKENKTWAKQTIAHNTVTINNKSQYNANVKIADEHHSDPYLFEVEDPNVQVMSAKENNAYDGVEMHRTLALVKADILEYPFIIDLYRLDTEVENQYDLPVYFQGQVITTNYDYSHLNTLKPMGRDHGYQHLWKEAYGTTDKTMAQMSWFDGSKFFSVSSSVEAGDSLIFTRIGANDKDYHLRRDPAYMLRRSNVASTTFANIIEIHGSYSPVTELAKNSYSSVKDVVVHSSDSEYSIIEIELIKGEKLVFALANNNTEKNKKHSIKFGDQDLSWTGPYNLFRNQ